VIFAKMNNDDNDEIWTSDTNDIFI